MTEPAAASDDKLFRLKSGAVIRAGWLQRDLPFLTRSLRFLLRPDGDSLRASAALEAGDIGVLAVVSQNPGITQNDLAASLVLKKSAVTRVVQRLEKRKLLQRQRSPSDRRANLLNVTAEGAALAETLRGLTRSQHDAWFANFDPAETALFFDVLFRLVAKLAQDRPADAPDGDDD